MDMNKKTLPVTKTTLDTKFLTLFVFGVMFCIQCRIAIINLLDPPSVDTTEERSISEIDLPIVTICPTNQTNESKLEELGYGNMINLYRGYARCETGLCLSWGKSVNLTFKELLKQVYKEDILKLINVNTGKQANLVTKIIPRFGYCYEVTDYNPEEEFTVSAIRYDFGTVRVFITDKFHRNYFSPDFSSQKGDMIISEQKKDQHFDVGIHITSSCKVVDTKDKDNDFEKCVEEIIQKEVGIPLGCVPPWLSPNNQCNENYLRNFTAAVPNFYNEYIRTLMTLDQTKIEERCRNSCQKLTATVDIRDVILAEKQSTSRVYLKFNSKVTVTEKVFNYSLFQFVIDVGSSLGLWLGLSMINLHDFVTICINFIKKLF